MRGKIVSYDSSKGVGKILIKNQGVKLFFVDNWIDYETMPEIGMEVEFGLENNKIIDISPINFHGSLFEKLNEKITYVLPNDLKIKEDISLDYCLEEFFEQFKKITLKYKDLLSSTKTLPYKKIKRFLLTAYNNLLEIDVSINDSRLREIKNSLDEVEYYYNKLQNEIKNPIYVLLEKLVLNKQKNYQVLKKRFNDNKSLITESTKKTNILEVKIEKTKNDLSKLNPKSKEYKELLNTLKSYKRKYVDLLDMMQDLKDENKIIVKDIDEFEKIYHQIFEKFFKKETNILLQLLNKEMDILAYQFDTILWENAKNSKSIQHFFKESKIEGSYSTKTFMKYYLKNLKTDKMNEKDSELVEIFNELKVFSKNIVICDQKRNRAREIMMYIENLDHDSDVKIFDNLKEFVLYVKENDANIDMIILEIEDTNKEMANKVIPFLEKIGVKIFLFSEKLNEYLNLNSLYKELKNFI